MSLEYLDVWVCQYEFPKRRVKCESIHTTSSAKHKLQFQKWFNQHEIFIHEKKNRSFHIRSKTKNNIPCKSFHTCSNQLLTWCSQIAIYHQLLGCSYPSPCKCRRSKCKRGNVPHQSNVSLSNFESVSYVWVRNSYSSYGNTTVNV